MSWLRWWQGTVTDPKFQWVARKSGQNVATVLAVWACLLERASCVTQCNAAKHAETDVTQEMLQPPEYWKGSVAGFDFESVDVCLGLDDGATQAVYAAMESKGLIQDGRLAGWDKRQPLREDNSTVRVRKYREKQRQEATGNTPTPTETTASDENSVTQSVTQSNDKKRNVTQRNTCNAPDVDIDKETDLKSRDLPIGPSQKAVRDVSAGPPALEFSDPDERPPKVSDDEWAVFNHWCRVLDHPRAKLGPKPLRLIRNTLKAYPVDDLKLAVIGCSNTAHNMGQNEKGGVFDGLHIVLKPENIDRFIRNAKHPPPTPGNHHAALHRIDHSAIGRVRHANRQRALADDATARTLDAEYADDRTPVGADDDDLRAQVDQQLWH